MNQYESACKLCATLKKVGITEYWISTGCVEIQYRPHQRKKLLDVLNGLGKLLDHIEYRVTLIRPNNQCIRQNIYRVQGKPVEIHNLSNIQV